MFRIDSRSVLTRRAYSNATPTAISARPSVTMDSESPGKPAERASLAVENRKVRDMHSVLIAKDGPAMERWCSIAPIVWLLRLVVAARRLDMSLEENKTAVRRLYEDVMNNGAVDLLEDLAAPDYIEHSPFPGQPEGIAGLKARLATIRAGLAPQYALQHLFGEGDMVAAHWTMTGKHNGALMGIPPTDRAVEISGIDIHRLRDGKLAEHWHVIETFEMLQQLGVLPVPKS